MGRRLWRRAQTHADSRSRKLPPSVVAGLGSPDERRPKAVDLLATEAFLAPVSSRVAAAQHHTAEQLEPDCRAMAVVVAAPIAATSQLPIDQVPEVPATCALAASLLREVLTICLQGVQCHSCCSSCRG